MAVDYSLTAINARLNAVITVIGSAGIVVLKDASNVTLSSITLTSPAGVVDGGVLVFTTPVLDISAAATGSAVSASITTAGGDVVISGLTVGTPLTPADVIISNGLNSTLISSGEVVELLSAEITEVN